ncbi:hypothetical protein [Bradyrhizobium sp. McL0616]|uniref:hypothetical protein n=1 Tax=Bradyrhizobium sp. McL0616 TaxID=3415674 RepID=UPI003CF8CAC6
MAAEKYDEADRSVKPKARVAEGIEEGAPNMGRKQDSGSYAAKMAEHARRIGRAAIVVDAPRNKPLTVLASAIEQRGGDKWLELDTSGGRVAIMLEASSSALQEEGQKHFGRLCDACGVSDVEDSSDLHGSTFMIAGDSFGPVTVADMAG